MKRYIFQNGFTLAEVLITLGVIGIVAALTIPNVTSNYRKKVVETRMAKFYTVINQAIRRSEADNGPVKYWDVLKAEEIEDENGDGSGYYRTNTIDWYKKYLKPYLIVQKVEETQENVQVQQETVEQQTEQVQIAEEQKPEKAKKPSLWQRFKNSKLVRTIKYVMKIRVVLDYPALPEGRGE